MEELGILVLLCYVGGRCLSLLLHSSEDSQKPARMHSVSPPVFQIDIVVYTSMACMKERNANRLWPFACLIKETYDKRPSMSHLRVSTPLRTQLFILTFM